MKDHKDQADETQLLIRILGKKDSKPEDEGGSTQEYKQKMMEAMRENDHDD